MPVRPKKRPRKRDPTAIAIGTPDAIAVYEDGELVGWDESAAHAYLAAQGKPCDGGCAARGHIDMC